MRTNGGRAALSKDSDERTMPRIGLGTAGLRGEEARRIARRALEIGYRHLDTAAMYGNEAEIGEAIRDAALPRAELWVTTKVWPDRHAPGEVQASAEASLKRLGLDRVDLLLLHWPNPDVPIERSVEALNDCAARGLAREIGVSNYPIALVERARAASARPLLTDQVEYHPHLEQRNLLAHLRKVGMTLTAYSPLGRGAVLREPTVREIAARHGKTPSQVALRWLLRQDGVVVIPRTSKPERLAENLAVFDFDLTDEEAEAVHGLARPDGRQIEVPGYTPAWD